MGNRKITKSKLNPSLSFNQYEYSIRTIALFNNYRLFIELKLIAVVDKRTFLFMIKLRETW